MTEVAGIVAALTGRIEALEASWQSDAEGWFLNLASYAPTPSNAHPRFTREHLARWWCGEWTDDVSAQEWPEIERKRVLCQQVADAVDAPLRFPPAAVPDSSYRDWWSAPPRPRLQWLVSWVITDRTDGEPITHADAIEVVASSAYGAFEVARETAEAHPRSESAVHRVVEFETSMEGHRFTFQEEWTFRLVCPAGALQLLRDVARGEQPLSKLLHTVIDDYKVDRLAISKLVCDNFRIDLAERRVWHTVDDWARGELDDAGLDEAFDGKLSLPESNESKDA